MVDLVSLAIGLGIGTGVAAVVGALAWRLGRSSEAAREASSRDQAAAQLAAQLAYTQGQLLERQRAAELQHKQFEAFLADEARLAQVLEGFSARALDENTRKLLSLAAQTLSPVGIQLKTELDGQLGKQQESISGVVKPLEAALKEMQELVRAIETARNQAYGGLDKQLQLLMSNTDALRRETSSLSGALRNSQAKGRWGEVALKNLVELAGLTEHCDFDTQVSLGGMDERVRPDMVVRLPSGRVVPVDSKVSSAAFIRAVETTDDKDRESALDEHAASVMTRIKELSAKEYSEKLRELGNVPEFVVMFIPGDNLFAAALSKDPSLFDEAVKHDIMLASPTVLLPLLRVVEMGWRQERYLKNVEEVQDHARELHDRLAIMTGHMQKLGSSLGGAVGSYNSLIGSYEARVMVQARKFKELGVEGTKPLPETLAPVETPVRRLAESPPEDESTGD
jgi:DNA recombination protein RmuC